MKEQCKWNFSGVSGLNLATGGWCASGSLKWLTSASV
jgi:hypothetical protein